MLKCPQCGSYDLRYARLRRPSERFWSWLGTRPLRCRKCRTRFIARTWRLENLRWARCPKCWRMDLSSWSEREYPVSALRRLLLALGAHPWRCEYCRYNFVSFRPRKEGWRPWSRRPPRATTAEQAAANKNGSE